MKFTLIDKQITAAEFNHMRKSVGWSVPSEQQTEMALQKTLFSVVAIYKNQIVGYGRLVGDGTIICYVQDLIVLPEYQGVGVGTVILKRLLSYVKENALPDTEVTVGLFASKGNESFYESFGFAVRPNERKGPGAEIRVQSYLPNERIC